MDRLSASDSWGEYAEECADFAGRSNLIEVAYLNWGKVLTLSGTPMKARCLEAVCLQVVAGARNHRYQTCSRSRST